MTCIRTDVLVVGSGAAGMLAARKAASLGFKVVLAHRGQLGRASASWIAGADFTVLDADAGDEVNDLVRDICSEGFHLNEPGHVRDYASNCGRVALELAEMGLPFRRLAREHGSERRRAGFIFGWEWCSRLVQLVESQPNIQAIPNARLLELLSDGASCGGGLFEVRESEVLAISAPFTILASGGWAGLFRDRTASAFAQGDGIASGARIGAGVAGMEFVQFVPFVPSQPALAANTLSLHFLATALGAGRLVREDGSRVLPCSLVHDGERGPKEAVQIALALEQIARPGRPLLLAAPPEVALNPGPVVQRLEAMLQRLPDPRWNRRDLLLPLLRKLIAGETIPVGMAAHFTLGGLMVDRAMATTVPGLLAVAECRTGLWGAGRVYSACTQCHSDVMALRFESEGRPPSAAACERERRRIGTVLREGGAPKGPLLRSIRRRLSTTLGPWREHDALEGTRTAARALLGTKDPRVRNPAIVLAMASEAALARRESRGNHVRLDHPATSPSLLRIAQYFDDDAGAVRTVESTEQGAGDRVLTLAEQLAVLQRRETSTLNADRPTGPTEACP